MQSLEFGTVGVALNHGHWVHATTVRRWLKQLSYGYRRARLTLCIRDSNLAQRMQAIERALVDPAPYTEVFYSDEADVNPNLCICPVRVLRGTQSAIPTPGKSKFVNSLAPSMRAAAR